MNLPALNYKRIGLIALFIIVVLGVGFLLYSFFFKSPAQPAPAPSGQESAGGNGLPQAGEGSSSGTGNGGSGSLPGSENPTPAPETTPPPPASANDKQAKALAQEASDIAVAQNGNVNFYNSLDNRFYSVSPDGKLNALSDKRFYGVEKATWSANGQKAVLEYPDGSNIRYDFARQNQVTLPKHWEDFHFSPDGNKLVAKSIGLDPNNRWLVVSNEDGSQAQQVQEMGENADKFMASWSPNGQSVALFVDGIDGERKEVYFVGQNGENFKSTVVEGRGFQPLWSPDGKELAYSVYSSASDYKPSLWIVGAQGDAIGANRRPLEINTWAQKCAFARSGLYCAVPDSLDRGAGLFDMSHYTTQDTLYRIDTATGLRQPIPLDATYSMTNLSLSPDGNYLYFLDSSSGQLRQVRIR